MTTLGGLEAGPGGSEGRLAADAAPGAAAVIDAVGLFCPVPILRTAASVRRMHQGEVAELRVDDPVALVDLPNWCAAMGHEYLGWVAEPPELRLFLRVGPGRLPRTREGRDRAGGGHGA